MRRADRLFRLVQVLRQRRFATADDLAEVLGVSRRTVYRDIRDLQDSDVPIQGEAGVGYTLDRAFELPPMSFTTEELEALVLGARMVRAWGDPALGVAATTAIEKVEAVLPGPMRAILDDSALFALRFGREPDGEANLALLRGAIRDRRMVAFAYEAASGGRTTRKVRPLGLYFWGRSWTLAAWDLLRDDWRSFRPDRMLAVDVLDETFPDDDKDLAAFVKAQGG
ncbi:MAG: YafY family transcriptional regulator [Alphaproteobacteria bacterium]|nr:YafY family transcriptional regulator [Alphaproteobacteria bacterium]